MCAARRKDNLFSLDSKHTTVVWGRCNKLLWIVWAMQHNAIPLRRSTLSWRGKTLQCVIQNQVYKTTMHHSGRVMKRAMQMRKERGERPVTESLCRCIISLQWPEPQRQLGDVGSKPKRLYRPLWMSQQVSALRYMLCSSKEWNSIRTNDDKKKPHRVKHRADSAPRLMEPAVVLHA